MLLVKEMAVTLNYVHFKFKHHISTTFRRHGYDITPEQFLVLDVLWNAEKGITQQQLADILKKDKNSITKLVDGLEKKAMLVRTADENDRRNNRVRLTDKALGISEDIQKVAEEAVYTAIKDIPESEIRMFIGILNRISGNMDSITDNRCTDGKTF